MKKTILIFIALALALCVAGCQTQSAVDTRVQVSITELEGCTVENNGQWVTPGDSATFVLSMDDGRSLAGTDYSGAYSSVVKDGKLELTLEDIQFPQRVTLELTQKFATVTYEPNGGAGEPVSVSYDLNTHIRPNTSIGTDLFSREGYTLGCWNTAPDGTGQRVGLGSRVSVEETLTLYAQWESWTEAADFTYVRTDFGTVTITGYIGTAETVVIPASIGGVRVTMVASRAFQGSAMRTVIFPTTMRQVAPQAFLDCAQLETVVLFDNIETVSDDVFSGCDALQTLYINAIEAPYGYDFRKESAYPDKVDLLIAAQGQQKLVLYSGCSGWYNLDGGLMEEAFGGAYTVINMGLNGTVNSAVQMQILGHFLEPGDVVLHTLELTSQTQLLTDISLGDKDDKLWSGLEYNYDLFALVDLRTVSGTFDSLCSYLDKKDSETTYLGVYTDVLGRTYMDEYGGVPYYREATERRLTDKVLLDPSYVDPVGMARLNEYYNRYWDSGVTVYVSYACVNMDEVPEDQRENVDLMDSLVRDALAEMDHAVLISDLSDYLYEYNDFFDTNYHLISGKAQENTLLWIRDLKAQMILDGLWTGE